MCVFNLGQDLSEKEKVTPQMVGTWFANKRKDIKKRIEGMIKYSFMKRFTDGKLYLYIEICSVFPQHLVQSSLLDRSTLKFTLQSAQCNRQQVLIFVQLCLVIGHI